MLPVSWSTHLGGRLQNRAELFQTLLLCWWKKLQVGSEPTVRQVLAAWGLSALVWYLQSNKHEKYPLSRGCYLLLKQINTAKIACRSVDKIIYCWLTGWEAGSGPGLFSEGMKMEYRKALVRRSCYFFKWSMVWWKDWRYHSCHTSHLIFAVLHTLYFFHRQLMCSLTRTDRAVAEQNRK